MIQNKFLFTTASYFLGHLSHSADLLQLVFVRFRESFVSILHYWRLPKNLLSYQLQGLTAEAKYAKKANFVKILFSTHTHVEKNSKVNEAFDNNCVFHVPLVMGSDLRSGQIRAYIVNIYQIFKKKIYDVNEAFYLKCEIHGLWIIERGHVLNHTKLRGA